MQVPARCSLRGWQQHPAGNSQCWSEGICMRLKMLAKGKIKLYLKSNKGQLCEEQVILCSWRETSSVGGCMKLQREGKMLKWAKKKTSAPEAAAWCIPEVAEWGRVLSTVIKQSRVFGSPGSGRRGWTQSSSSVRAHLRCN